MIPTVSGLVRRAFGWHRPLMLSAAFCAVIGVVAAVGLVVDDRILIGAPIWAKPGKFAISFGLYAVTSAWMLSLQRRHVRLGRILGTVAAVTGTVEVAIIALQTVRGHRSHFNWATPFDTTMWMIMASSIAVLWLANLVGAVLLMLERHADRPALWALRLGTLIALAGMAVAFLMTRSTPEQRADPSIKLIGGHSVGVPEGGPGLAVTNWSTTGGDLRVPHFVGIHALQAVPLFAMLLGLLMAGLPRLRDELVRIRLVWTFAGGYAGLFVLVTWQALRAQPLLRPDLLTGGALGVLVAATLVAAVWALRSRRMPAPAPVHEEVRV
jgi:hypothetical protein